MYLMLIFSLGLALDVAQVFSREATRNWIVANGGGYSEICSPEETSKQISPIRRCLGDEEVAMIVMDRRLSQTECETIRAVFPELDQGLGVWKLTVFLNERLTKIRHFP